MVESSFPVQVLFGIYLGVLTGIIPGLVAWSLGFLFKYFTGVTIPGLGVVVLGVALAGVNGGLLALADPTITQSANAVTVTTAILIVLMISLYAHSRGDKMGAEFPKRLTLRGLRERTLSADVLGTIAGRDEVHVRVVGDVADMEGYPPLPDDLRAEIRAGEWTFPADLRISELESRLAKRLKTEYDLGDVAVSIDAQGRAAVVAAPPFSGLSKRVPDGKRAVSVDALLPTGLARNDEVTLVTADAQISGTVVSARSASAKADGNPTVEPSADAEESTVPPARAARTTGGEGRLTAAVTRSDAEALLETDHARVVVESRGVRREYELVSLLRRSGRRFKRLTVRAGASLDGATLGPADVRTTYDVSVLAVQHSGNWVVAPRGEVELEAGDDLLVVGTRDGLSALEGAVA